MDAGPGGWAYLEGVVLYKLSNLLVELAADLIVQESTRDLLGGGAQPVGQVAWYRVGGKSDKVKTTSALNFGFSSEFRPCHKPYGLRQRVRVNHN
jgi:hypothetical protein